jgi:hypothetical protein
MADDRCGIVTLTLRNNQQVTVPEASIKCLVTGSADFRARLSWDQMTPAASSSLLENTLAYCVRDAGLFEPAAV